MRDNTMNIQPYLVPASAAAAFHVAVLFGFSPRVPAVPPMTPPVIKTTDAKIVPFELFVPPERNSETKPVAVDAPRGESPPDLLEPPRDDTSPRIIETMLDPVQPTTVPEVNRIGPPGVPDGPGPASWTHLVDSIHLADQLDRVPRALAQIPPHYPSELKTAGIEGSAFVEFDVDINGRVTSARVIKCSRHEFEGPTLQAVLKWRFEPGLNQGRPVPFRMAVPVNFRLDSI
jgi:protein TonB